MTPEPLRLTGGAYIRRLWLEGSPRGQRLWRRLLLLGGIIWLLGAIMAYEALSGAAGSPVMRVAAATVSGPWGIGWRLVNLGVWSADLPSWQEALAANSLLWLVGLGLWHVRLPWPWQVLIERRRFIAAQGWLSPAQVAQENRLETGIPLAMTPVRSRTPSAWVVQSQVPDEAAYLTGIPPEAVEGHVLIVTPDPVRWDIHLTETLYHWPGAAIVLDPTGAQYRRIHQRRKKFFPWPRYPIPLHKLYVLTTSEGVRRWHGYWLRPHTEAEALLSDHCLSLFLAAAAYAQAQKLDPVRVLLDMAVSDPHEVLTALDDVAASRPFVRQFTRGSSGEVVVWDEGIAAAYTFFTTRLHPYQAYLPALAPLSTHDVPLSVLDDWVTDSRIIYALYEDDELAQAPGLWPLLITGLIEHPASLRRKPVNYFPSPTKTEVKPPLLVVFPITLAWPEMLKELVHWRARGIIALFYASSLPQLHTVLGQAGAEALLAQCPHQVWGIPNDVTTAGYMSQLAGMDVMPRPQYTTSETFDEQHSPFVRRIQHSYSWNWQETPLWRPEHILAETKGWALVVTGMHQRRVFVAGQVGNVSGWEPCEERGMEMRRWEGMRPREITAWLVERKNDHSLTVQETTSIQRTTLDVF